MFLISGEFTQQINRLGIGYAPEMGEVATVAPHSESFPYMGLVYRGAGGNYEGFMLDLQGDSTLSNIVIDLHGGRIAFRKEYNFYRNAVAHPSIAYEFTKKDQFAFVGTWKRHDGGTGTTSCTIHFRDDSRFETILNMISAYKPEGVLDGL